MENSPFALSEAEICQSCGEAALQLAQHALQFSELARTIAAGDLGVDCFRGRRDRLAGALVAAALVLGSFLPTHAADAVLAAIERSVPDTEVQWTEGKAVIIDN